MKRKKVDISVYRQKGKKQHEAYFAIDRKKCIVKRVFDDRKRTTACNVFIDEKNPP
jgi:hypothetical protein